MERLALRISIDPLLSSSPIGQFDLNVSVSATALEIKAEIFNSCSQLFGVDLFTCVLSTTPNAIDAVLDEHSPLVLVLPALQDALNRCEMKRQTLYITTLDRLETPLLLEDEETVQAELKYSTYPADDLNVIWITQFDNRRKRTAKDGRGDGAHGLAGWDDDAEMSDAFERSSQIPKQKKIFQTTKIIPPTPIPIEDDEIRREQLWTSTSNFLMDEPPSWTIPDDSERLLAGCPLIAHYSSQFVEGESNPKVDPMLHSGIVLQHLSNTVKGWEINTYGEPTISLLRPAPRYLLSIVLPQNSQGKELVNRTSVYFEPIDTPLMILDKLFKKVLVKKAFESDGLSINPGDYVLKHVGRTILYNIEIPLVNFDSIRDCLNKEEDLLLTIVRGTWRKPLHRNVYVQPALKHLGTEVLQAETLAPFKVHIDSIAVPFVPNLYMFCCAYVRMNGGIVSGLGVTGIYRLERDLVCLPLCAEVQKGAKSPKGGQTDANTQGDGKQDASSVDNLQNFVGGSFLNNTKWVTVGINTDIPVLGVSCLPPESEIVIVVCQVSVSTDMYNMVDKQSGCNRSLARSVLDPEKLGLLVFGDKSEASKRVGGSTTNSPNPNNTSTGTGVVGVSGTVSDNPKGNQLTATLGSSTEGKGGQFVVNGKRLNNHSSKLSVLNEQYDINALCYVTLPVVTHIHTHWKQGEKHIKGGWDDHVIARQMASTETQWETEFDRYKNIYIKTPTLNFTQQFVDTRASNAPGLKVQYVNGNSRDSVALKFSIFSDIDFAVSPGYPSIDIRSVITNNIVNVTSIVADIQGRKTEKLEKDAVVSPKPVGDSKGLKTLFSRPKTESNTDVGSMKDKDTPMASTSLTPKFPVDPPRPINPKVLELLRNPFREITKELAYQVLSLAPILLFASSPDGPGASTIAQGVELREEEASILSRYSMVFSSTLQRIFQSLYICWGVRINSRVPPLPALPNEHGVTAVKYFNKIAEFIFDRIRLVDSIYELEPTKGTIYVTSKALVPLLDVVNNTVLQLAVLNLLASRHNRMPLNHPIAIVPSRMYPMILPELLVKLRAEPHGLLGPGMRMVIDAQIGGFGYARPKEIRDSTSVVETKDAFGQGTGFDIAWLLIGGEGEMAEVVKKVVLASFQHVPCDTVLVGAANTPRKVSCADVISRTITFKNALLRVAKKVKGLCDAEELGCVDEIHSSGVDIETLMTRAPSKSDSSLPEPFRGIGAVAGSLVAPSSPTPIGSSQATSAATAAAIAESKKKANKYAYLQLLLRDEIQPMFTSDTFGNTPISLPLMSDLYISGVISEKSFYFTSKKKPLCVCSVPYETVDIENTHQYKFMLKHGDDLRQDVLTMQLLTMMSSIWQEAGIDPRMTLYRIVPTGYMEGMIEIVDKSVTLAHISKTEGGTMTGAFKKETIANFLKDKNKSDSQYSKVVDNFCHSCSSYAVATYVLGIGDRHNDNIMVTFDGHLFHIDFGHFLGHFKTKLGVKREKAPFVLTPDMVYVMGGKKGAKFEEFINLCQQKIMILRQHASVLCTMLRMMISAGLPELVGEENVRWLLDTLMIEKKDSEVPKAFRELVFKSLSTITTMINNQIHIYVN